MRNNTLALIGLAALAMGLPKLVSAAQETPDPLAACTAAVHGNLADAVSACAGPKGQIDIFSPGGPDGICLEALGAGQRAGRYGPSYSGPMRAGLIREYDKKAAACHAPRRPPTPTLNITDISD